jgi:hypothetical protein
MAMASIKSSTGKLAVNLAAQMFKSHNSRCKLRCKFQSRPSPTYRK